MKNILQLINLSSSAEIFIGDQLSFFQEKGGCRMHLVCSDTGNLRTFAEGQGVDFMALKLSRQLSPLQDIKSFFAICKYIRKHKIDTIICHQAKARTLGIPAARLMGVRHRIIFAHGVLYETMRGLKRNLVLNNERILSRMATQVICVSRYVMDARERDGIDNSAKQVIIGNGSCNGIDTVNKFNSDLVSGDDVQALRIGLGLNADDFVIGFCGRLVKDKGVAELAEGFSLIRSRHPKKQIKLLIIGQPEKRDSVSQEVMDYLLETPGVIFTGTVPYRDIQKYYLLMSVLLFPSHRDGLGLTPLEAQAMCVPALVTKITGCRETVLENVTGSYVDLSGESICSEIEKYFDESKRKESGYNGRIFVRDYFEHQAFLDRMLCFLKSLDNE